MSTSTLPATEATTHRVICTDPACQPPEQARAHSLGEAEMYARTHNGLWHANAPLATAEPIAA